MMGIVQRERPDLGIFLQSAFVGVSIALDEIAKARKLDCHRHIGVDRPTDCLKPLLQKPCFARETQRTAANPLERRQPVKQQKSPQGRRPNRAPPRRQTRQNGFCELAAEQPSSDRRRHGVRDLFDAWVHEFDNLNDLVSLGADLLADTLEPDTPDLEFGHADGVLVSHSESKLTCYLAKELLAADT